MGLQRVRHDLATKQLQQTVVHNYDNKCWERKHKNSFFMKSATLWDVIILIYVHIAEYEALLISGYMLFYLSIILQEANFPLLLKWNIWYVIIF